MEIAARQMAMIAAPNRSAFSGPMPETVRRSEIVCGLARTRLRRTASPKTMKAGLPVLAASDLRHARSLPSSCCCAGVKAAVVWSRSAVLRGTLLDFDFLDFVAGAPGSSVSGSRISGAWILPVETASRPS